jgi:hypothetical protein
MTDCPLCPEIYSFLFPELIILKLKLLNFKGKLPTHMLWRRTEHNAKYCIGKKVFC